MMENMNVQFPSAADLCNIDSEDLLGNAGFSETFSQIEQIIRNIEHVGKDPTFDDVETDHAFNFRMDQSQKSNWFYNDKENKVFIKVNNVITLDFSYKPLNASKLFIRAMIVYSNPDDMHLTVQRCPNHQRKANSSNEVTPLAHILKCHHPRAEYCGTPEGRFFGDRLSVRLQLDNHGMNDIGEVQEKIRWEFLCQNSCVGGMNRRATTVIFTLENELFEIVGKKVMHFKVCSCPKRDNEIDNRRKEMQSGKNRKRMKALSGTATIKSEPLPMLPLVNNDASAEGPSTVILTMPNRNSMNHVLHCAYNECIGLIARQENGHHDTYMGFANKIQETMNNINSNN